MKKSKVFFETCFAVILIMIILNCFFNFSQAVSISEMISQTDDFINKGKSQVDSDITTGVTDALVPLGQLLTYIGAGIYVAVITFMGIKYITSSPDGQAKLKQQLIGIVASGIVIFGAYGIWKVIVNILSGI